jgi:rSAM/selenodomain-associated transferase 1
MSTAIGIICKAPEPGRTKTRLAARIGARAAADLSACFLRDLAATVAGIAGQRGYAVYAPAGGEAVLRGLMLPGFGFLLQTGRDLGEVLLGATRSLLEAGHEAVLLVNGDSPTLPGRLLVQAIESLRAPGDRVVLGPASDGGYYLIGLKRPHPRVFAEVNWGTASVFVETCMRADEIALPLAVLPEWYDIDDEETLSWLRDELEGRSSRFADGAAAPFTRAYLAAMPESGR